MINELILSRAGSASIMSLAILSIGSLRSDDGSGYQKVNAGRFKLYDAYPIPFNLSNVGKWFWSLQNQV